MPNGGYPIWMLLNLTAVYALRFKGSEMWLVTKQEGRWVNVHQIPPTAIRAMLYHVAYWGISDSGEAWRGTKFIDERIERGSSPTAGASTTTEHYQRPHKPD